MNPGKKFMEYCSIRGVPIDSLKSYFLNRSQVPS